MNLLDHPRLRKYTSLVHRDLSAAYSRDLHKWLIVAPIIGVSTGLLITLISEIILKWMWPSFLNFYIRHPLAMIPGLAIGFVIAGLLMQYLTPDPDEHSTEEIIRSYHEHQGDIRMRAFVPKLAAAIATVGFGGSAALEGPSIYGGGAIGSWLWTLMKRFRMDAKDRRIMLICGAAAGMGAVFRAPFTGIVFALEMPYKDDMAHEALLPSLIASVIAYATLASFFGTQPLFNFAGGSVFSGRDLIWVALLGAICGLIAMVFDITYRHARTFSIRLRVPHWIKMAAGGILTGLCGWGFLTLYKGSLVPIGPNYEAVSKILLARHGPMELIVFGVLKLAATLFSLGVGGVSAMFVPLFLTGGSFGAAFAHLIGQNATIDLFAAAGMAAFIAAGYKTPLAAVVFVAEATGGHSYIIPALIAAAVASAVSGEASASGDQKLRETVKTSERWRIPVGEVMQREVVAVEAASSLKEFGASIGSHNSHAAYPVYESGEPVGVFSTGSLGKVPVEDWEKTKVGQMADRQVARVPAECELSEALRLLVGQAGRHMLFVTSPEGRLEGIVTKTDILAALNAMDGSPAKAHTAGSASAKPP